MVPWSLRNCMLSSPVVIICILLTYVQMLTMGFITVLGFPTNLSWWAFILAVGVSFSFALPIGIIQAITSYQIGLNVLTEFIFGYIQPGRPLALMLYVG